MSDARVAEAARLTATAAAYCAAAWLGVWLSRDAGNVAAFWPADGLLLGVLLRRRPERWPAPLAACAGAKLVVSLLLGDSLAVSAGFLACNMVQVVSALLLVEWVAGTPLRLASLRELGAFLLAAGVAAPAIGASTAALVLHHALAAPFWTVWRTW